MKVAGAAGGGNNYHPGGFAKYLGRGPKLGDIMTPGFTMAHHGSPWLSFIEGPPFFGPIRSFEASQFSTWSADWLAGI